ncbi:sporulation-delaying protein SdpB family protein [Pedobacter cryoconitis]|uniref:Antimicrobial peptide system SdpB family protein n=1 Tax=Pedobacter cryoconitis TaxID=188932 RepID=A0A327RUR6_9SPHI|nr:sporulation-delaying protein SdpB family protein [Pedobacter cryoconitis]RAJ19878.1 antimicrobial peptide system SdpB family protein [Pedobacter cryoconitis]
MWIVRINKRIDSLIIYLTEKDIFNYRLGIARTILALSTLLTLIANDDEVLFKTKTINLTDSFNNKDLFQNINFFSLFGFDHLYVAKFIAIIILLIVISGWRPRYVCLFHFWICVSFFNSVRLVEGGDQIASILTLLLVPVLLCDDRKWHWNKAKKKEDISFGNFEYLIANCFHIIIKLQICLLYFHAAIGKMPNQEWSNGTAVYYWFNDPIFGMSEWIRPILDPILANPIGVAMITWSSILLEVLLFMSILMSNRAKYFFLILGLTFHFFIIIIHGLISFFFAMSAGLLLYLWIDNEFGKIFFLEKFLIKKKQPIGCFENL